MIGKTILHYKIIEKLGEGGMGVVYLAEDNKLKRQVAIKFLPGHIAGNSDERKRFEIEAQAAAALNHSNIATIHAIEESDDQLFLVMEYIEGKELKVIVRAQDFVPQQDAITFAIQIVEGLQAAHNKGIVHRDIKSANIMVTPDDKVKIMDFGLAKFRGSAQLTQIGTTLGTAAYMSPEQAKGEEVDQRSDIWSLGVVLYEMLTGELPFKGDYEQAVIYSILNEEPDYSDNLPENIKLIFEKTLAKDTAKRYQQIEQLLSDLKLIEKGESSVQTKSTLLKKHPRKKVYLYSGLALIIILVTLMSIFFYPKEEKGKSIDLVAVLPFTNNKPNPDTDYLGFAIADQIIGDLCYLKNISVRPSSAIRKYEKQIIDPKTVGDDLNVNYLLTGNYLKEGNVIRLNVELVEADTREMIWREPIEIDFRNAFELQDIVSQKVVNGLNVQFSQNELDRIGIDAPENPLAYEYYLRSVSYPHTNEGDQLAIEMLKRSIELDSSYAPAYDQLGFRTKGLAQFGLLDPEETKKAESYFLKALSKNSVLLSALGNLAILYTETAKTEEAVEITKQMLEINPNNAEAHYTLGYVYRYAGMLNESILEMEKAIAIDSKNPRFRSWGVAYLNIGEYEKAFNAFDIVKGSTYSLGWQSIILFRQGNQERAIDYFNRIIALEPEGLWAFVAETYKALIEGNNKKGLIAVQKLEQANITDSEAWYYWAGLYGLLGERDGCIRCLRRAVEGGYFDYPFMSTDFFLETFRDDPEFQKIIEQAKEKHLAFKKKFFPEKF